MPVRWSSTAATLSWARGLYGKALVENVSWWQAHGQSPEAAQKKTGRPRGVRKDAWGFQDIQVLDNQSGVLAIQACGSDVGAHLRKMAGEIQGKVPDDPKKQAAAWEAADLLAYRVRQWLVNGNRLLLVGWRDVWVQTSERHRTKKKAPRFLEAVLTPHPPGLSLGLSDREVEWIEHQEWPPKKGSAQ